MLSSGTGHNHRSAAVRCDMAVAACTDNHPEVYRGLRPAAGASDEAFDDDGPDLDNSTLDHTLCQLTGTHDRVRGRA
jgi:hypothetical protein